MRVAIAADHAGFELKQIVAAHLRGLNFEVTDLSPGPPDPLDDYPDSAEALGNAIIQGAAGRGILICGSGVGASVAANKIHGIRAGLCHDNYSAHQGVEHDDMNVLVLGGRIIGVETAKELSTAFLNAHFSGEPRHVRRLAKILKIEQKY